jgi:DNA-binding response OmpR family regulator
MHVAVHPSSPSPALSEALLLGGVAVKLIDDPESPTLDLGDANVLIVELGDDPLRRLREARRLEQDTGVPLVVIAARDQLSMLADHDEITDFLVGPPDPLELKIRLGRLGAGDQGDEILIYRDLSLNTATYQALIGGRHIDLTYMEYELLRFFVTNQGRVWSREQLLSKVWGYDYFGGARTVDVHVRRLRSKLGEERASWITTVRSVGYRFG